MTVWQMTKWTQTALGLLIILLCRSRKIQSFLLDHASYPDIPEKDYTLRELTEETLVRVVARYFEDSNVGRFDTGDLLKLRPLTPSTLFNTTFGDCVSSAKFKAVIGEIIEGNLNVDRKFNHISDWHFNAEQILEGNKRMVGLRNTILTSLKKDQPDYAGIRENIGRYMHLLQDFYSNTNWVNLYPDKIHSDLGIRELSDVVASSDMYPCKNCYGPPISGKPERHDCVKSNNYSPFASYLFSGYRDVQDIAKPKSTDRSWGKCSHGGKYDGTWRQVATGGINKDTSDPAISPHYHLHEKASFLAIRAGEAFFIDKDNGLRAYISDEKFQKLLNLETGAAIAMVIDDTGSMSEEIDSVKDMAINGLTRFRGTCLASVQYIVSPFNDPGTGPLTVTTDPDVCIAALQALVAHDGGDCPELCMAGIEAALQHVIYPGTKVYIWTDADPKDEERMPDVLALAREKKANLIFLLTGTCNRRRRKRAVNPYSALAEATGGAIYHTDDSNIDSVSNIVIADTAASEVSVLRWYSDDFTNVSLNIAVDDTMEQLSIKLSGPTPRNDVTLFDPAGSVVPFTSDSIEVIVDTMDIFIILLSTSHFGTWVLSLNGVVRGESFQIEVSGRSFLDLTYQILTKEDNGVLTPVGGLPLAGSNVTILVDTISPDLIQSFDDLLLHDANGQRVLLQSPLTVVVGGSGIYVVDVTLPAQAFTVSAMGTDLNGNTVQRLHPAVVQVLGFTLGISNENNTIDNLVPGGSGTFDLILDNTGAADTFDLLFSTTTRSASMVTPITGNVVPSNISLEYQETATGVVTLQADQTAVPGDSILLTVTMTSQTTGERNFVSLGVTLTEQIHIEQTITEDIASPSCSVLNGTGACTSEMITNNCSSQKWSIRIALEDDQGIAEIVVTDYEESAGQYTLDRSNASNIDVIYESNCCCPNVNFTVTDVMGKSDRCGVDYLTEEAEHNPAALCIRDCDETTLCQNGGLCIRGRCECASGFNGTLCENNIDDCVNHTCKNEGICEDEVQGYQCNCEDTGYQGEFCEIDIHYCLEDPCKNGGICIEESKKFRCNCTGTGYKGDICELDIDECREEICHHEGICTNDNGTYDCNCTLGWEGLNCEKNIDECLDGDPCVNNATCEDTQGGFRCLCLPGFVGTNCETNMDECASDPCQNGGACIDMVDQYRCDCGVFGGTYCDIVPGQVLNAPAKVYSQLGGTIEFNCTVYSNYIVPEITWYGTNGNILQDASDRISITESVNSQMYKTSLLSVQNVSQADDGSYLCIVNITRTIYSEEQHHGKGKFDLHVLGPEDIQQPVLASKDTPNRITASTFRMKVSPASQRIGPIGCYEVVVIPLERDAPSPSGDPNKDYPPSKITDYQSSRAKPGYPYSALLIEGKQLSEPISIIIGDGRWTNCSDIYSIPSRKKREVAYMNVEAENGPLQPGTMYSTFTRAYIVNGNMQTYSSSQYMMPISTKRNNNAWIHITVPVVIVIIVVIMILLVLYRCGHRGAFYPVSREVEDGHGVELKGADNPAIYQGAMENNGGSNVTRVYHS